MLLLLDNHRIDFLHRQLLLVALVVASLVVFGEVDAAETRPLDLTERGLIVRFFRPVPFALTLWPPEFGFNNFTVLAELARLLAEQVELHSWVRVAGEDAADCREPVSGHCRPRLLLHVLQQKFLLLLCVILRLLVTVQEEHAVLLGLDFRYD